ncbi:MAG: bifunctional riboflavin kinase/FAD synthetase [Oscillospiraceae bacterium]|nr:bifunctional riboflavin kinase/FAD synthetase [Oscillospiraceae bacterium]
MTKKVVALGFFDGVHIGHGALLSRCAEIARENNLKACVMTYSRHPSEVVAKSPIKLINTTEERHELIEKLYGIRDIVIKDFTAEYAALSCREFAEKILREELSSAFVVAGFDFRFGRGGEGDAEKLSKLCRELDIGCEIISEVALDGEKVSSSRIRAALEKGDVAEATRLLGHNWCIISEVTHGKELGRTIDFPTINQGFCENRALPRFGVYASRVTVEGKAYPAITNIGVRPTVEEKTAPRAETHILNFSGELYGEIVRTELVEFIRDEKKFSTIAELRAQIEKDIASATGLLKV